MFYSKNNNFKVSVFPKVDLRNNINRMFEIRDSAQFLVLKVDIPWSKTEISCWCIAKKSETDRVGAEVTHVHWGFVQPELLIHPKVEMPRYTPSITHDMIQEFAGQFETIEDAVACYRQKVTPSPRAAHKSNTKVKHPIHL